MTAKVVWPRSGCGYWYSRSLVFIAFCSILRNHYMQAEDVNAPKKSKSAKVVDADEDGFGVNDDDWHVYRKIVRAYYKPEDSFGVSLFRCRHARRTTKPKLRKKRLDYKRLRSC